MQSLSIWPRVAAHPWLTAAAAALATGVAVVVSMNLMSGEKRIQTRLERLYPLDDPRFAQELGVLLGPPLLEGNRVDVLRNGDEIFPAMLAGVRGARRTINFETYIYWSGAIGQEMADALVERARAGVTVNLLFDWVGSLKMDERLIAQLKEGGVHIQRYHRPHWSDLGRLNNRTHRKLLVVDGTLGFTGGVGIAPQWSGDAQDPDHWRDTHFRVEGPVVGQMQSVFLDNWIKTSGEVLNGPDYFPVLHAAGTSRAQVFSSSPTGGSESMALMYQLAITAASKTIDLSAAYFVPDDLTTKALVEALGRGVRLRIVVPGEHIDSDTVRSASRAKWGPLLAAGAVIAEYRPTMYHCKTMVVDGLLVSVGSTNFDNRSFRLNDEATLNVVDVDFAARLTQLFEADLARSTVVSHAAWAARPLREKAVERAAGLLDAQL